MEKLIPCCEGEETKKKKPSFRVTHVAMSRLQCHACKRGKQRGLIIYPPALFAHIICASTWRSAGACGKMGCPCFEAGAICTPLCHPVRRKSKALELQTTCINVCCVYGSDSEPKVTCTNGFQKCVVRKPKQKEQAKQAEKDQDRSPEPEPGQRHEHEHEL